MGSTWESINISVTLSRHNSEQDDIDDDAFTNLKREVRELCARDDYKHLDPIVS
jgi:hypothetical protein